ncbi:MAG: sulfatase [Planctomycetota bacterium]
MTYLRMMMHAFLVVVGVSALASDVNTRPHILYINADDLGVMDVGYNDATFKTPHIDALASRGMVFTNAYAPAANCAPSRACVHSGQWGPRHGVYTVGSAERGNTKHRKLIPIPNAPLLDTENLTMAEVLQANGYQTIHLGKYHIGADPAAEGFDINVGGDASGSPTGGYYSPWEKGAMAQWTDTLANRSDEPGKDKPTHRVDVFAERAVAFIEANHRKPMFIHFSPYLVHTPLTKVPEFFDTDDTDDVDPRYRSMVRKIDQAIGQLIDTLDRLALIDSTLIVFSSDNGGIAAVHTQSPWRAGKGSYYEGGIREPMVICWSDHIDANQTCHTPVSTLDLFPTFLEAAGIDLPDGKTLDGTSLMPLLTQSGQWQPRNLYWHFPIYLQAYSKAKDDGRDPFFRTRPGSAMRSGKWKLHEYFEDGSIELYDLQRDPGERSNLAPSLPEKASDLHQQLVLWRENVDAPVPTQRNPDYRSSRR